MKNTTITVSEYHFGRLEAMSVEAAFLRLLALADEVEYVVRSPRKSKLSCSDYVNCRFHKSEKFFLWRDCVKDIPIIFNYVRRFDDVCVVTVSLRMLLESVVGKHKWRVSTLNE